MTQAIGIFHLLFLAKKSITREVGWLLQGHSVGEWQYWGSNPYIIQSILSKTGVPSGVGNSWRRGGSSSPTSSFYRGGNSGWNGKALLQGCRAEVGIQDSWISLQASACPPLHTSKMQRLFFASKTCLSNHPPEHTISPITLLDAGYTGGSSGEG